MMDPKITNGKFGPESAVRIKQIGILFEDLVHVSMLPSVLIGRHIRE